MLSVISKGRRVKQPSEIYRPVDLLPYMYTQRHFSEICVAFGTVYVSTLFVSDSARHVYEVSFYANISLQIDFSASYCAVISRMHKLIIISSVILIIK
jgi:hypothetical protein